MTVMVSLLGSGLALMIRWLGLGWVIRNTIARKGVSIIVYHDPDSARLSAHLEYIHRRYSVIPLERLVDAPRSGHWDDIPPKSVVINLDDGHVGNFALMDLFHKYRIEPTVFLCTQVVGTNRAFWFKGLYPPTLQRLEAVDNGERLRVLAEESGFHQHRDLPTAERQGLSRAEILAMREACAFGAHSRFHPALTTCTDYDAWEEMAGSKSEVEALVGRRCDHFAYPAGRFAHREADMAERAGYLSARTVDIGWNTPGTDPYRLKVLSMDSRSTTMLAAELAGHKWLARLVNGTGGLRGDRRPARGHRR